MEIFQVVGLGLTAVILLLVLREQGSSLGMLVTLAFGILIFMLILDKIGAVLTVFQELGNRAGVNLIYVSTIFKVMGIAYLAEFSAQICRDAGSQAIAGNFGSDCCTAATGGMRFEQTAKENLVLFALNVIFGAASAGMGRGDGRESFGGAAGFTASG